MGVYTVLIALGSIFICILIGAAMPAIKAHSNGKREMEVVSQLLEMMSDEEVARINNKLTST